MTFDEIYDAIVADPENDSLREQLAEACRVSDPDRARFIDLQNARARQRRAERSHLPDPSRLEDALLATHETAWSRTLSKYTTHRKFYRGAVESIQVDPFIFLEYGEWLFELAPLCEVRFTMPDDGALFPLDDLLASPLLARLDSICFAQLPLGDADVEKIAASPNLERCLVLDLSYNELSFRSFEALAASASTRKFLYIVRDGAESTNYIPGERFAAIPDSAGLWGPDDWDWTEIDAEGKELERRHGYIPWLHHENMCSYFDARWYVDRALLPVQPAGSAVKAF